MFLIEENLFKTSIKYNYHDTLFNNIIIILNLKFEIPIEIINKIIYEFNGIQHPIANMIKYGKGWSWSNTFKDTFFKIDYSKKKYMLLFSLDRSELFICNKIICSFCKKKDTNYYLTKSVSYTNINNHKFSNVFHTPISTSEQYKSWTQTLLNLQKLYGPNLQNYLCRHCYRTCYY